MKNRAAVSTVPESRDAAVAENLLTIFMSYASLVPCFDALLREKFVVRLWEGVLKSGPAKSFQRNRVRHRGSGHGASFFAIPQKVVNRQKLPDRS